MDNNSKNITALTAIYVFISFQIESFLYYDVFHSPFYNVFLKTTFSIIVTSIFVYFLCDLYSFSKTKLSARKSIVALLFISWILIKLVQIVAYAQGSTGPKGFNIMIIIEWLELIGIAFIISKIYEIKKGFSK